VFSFPADDCASYIVINAGCTDKDLAHFDEHIKQWKAKGPYPPRPASRTLQQFYLFLSLSVYFYLSVKVPCLRVSVSRFYVVFQR
jgi:hypothetical protein